MPPATLSVVFDRRRLWPPRTHQAGPGLALAPELRPFQSCLDLRRANSGRRAAVAASAPISHSFLSCLAVAGLIPPPAADGLRWSLQPRIYLTGMRRV